MKKSAIRSVYKNFSSYFHPSPSHPGIQHQSVIIIHASTTGMHFTVFLTPSKSVN